MKRLRLSLFGVPRLEDSGAAIDISRGRTAALLALLAVTREAHDSDALTSLLWPEEEPARAHASLQDALSGLHALLGPDVLQWTAERATIVTGTRLWLDVHVFQEAVAHVRMHHPAARRLCDDCAQRLTAAAALYQDDFLRGFEASFSPTFDAWQSSLRAQLRHDLAEVLQRVIDRHVAAAEFEQAIGYGRRWVALDPGHEAAHRRLMQLYTWLGQPSAAMRQFAEMARRLPDKGASEPEAETVALYEAIRTGQLTAPRTRLGPTGAAREGRYELLDLLAVGGHAEVYYGRDRENDADVVIKRIKGELLVRDPVYLERFIREGTALSRLDHPNIVRMLATFEEAGQHAIVMEYVQGGSLRQLLDREGALPVSRALDIALELADALARAHHLNVIHRDLKPDNILLAEDGTPRLTDFGLARLRREDVRLTRTGTVMGSPAYMSPEALRGEELDARSDIWSFGVVLFEMITGRKPFDGEQLTPVLVSILQDEAPLMSDLRPDAPPALVDLVRRMLQKDAAQRPLSMRQVAAELEAIVQGDGHDLIAVRSQPQANRASPPAVVEPPAFAEHRFVAREETLAQMGALLQKALAGKGTVAMVTGDAGHGKTSLLQAFMQQHAALYPSLLIATGNCNAYTGSGDPYLPFREILEALIGNAGAQGYTHAPGASQMQRLQEASPHALAALVESGPDLVDTFIPARAVLRHADLLPQEASPWREQLDAIVATRAARREQPSLQQSDLFEQYARFLKALARQHPLLLVVDDLQWIDQGSANLLQHLGRAIQGQPIMIAGACRAAEVALGRDGSRHPMETVLYELQRLYGRILFDLSQEEGRAFVEALLDSEPNVLDETFRETLFRQTGGHPLFTVELLRGMQERGDLAKDDAGRWTAQPDLAWNRLPARVEGAIGERISRLSPQLLELLEVASVEGEEFTVETVASVLDKDARVLARLFSGELDRNHLLVRALGARQAGNTRVARYRFRHILIQRYLYLSMDDVERAYQHEAVGEALEALYGASAPSMASQLARHFELAELPSKAAQYHLEAGDQARQAIALGEATFHYEAALSLGSADDHDAQATLLRKLGECQWIMGDLQVALETHERCYKLYERMGNLQGAGAVQRAVGRLYWEIGEREQSLHHYHRSLETLEKIPESVELAWTYSSISQMHKLASQHEESVSWGRRALALARRLGAADVITHAMNNVGVSYIETGKVEEGRALLQESLKQALALGLPHDACRAYLNLGELPSGDVESRRRLLHQLVDYASEIRAPLYAGSAHVELANIEWDLGEWRTALARNEEIARWMARAPSIGYLRAIRSVWLGRVYNDLGQPQQALEALEETLALVRRQNEVQLLGPHLGQLARALAASGQGQRAAAILQELIIAIEGQPHVHHKSAHSLLFAATWLAQSPLKPDDHGHSRSNNLALAQLCRDLLAKGDSYGVKPEMNAALHEAGGMILLAEKHERAAAEALQKAADRWRTLSMPLDEARALSRLATVLHSLGDASGHEAATKRAAALYGELADELDDNGARQAFLGSAAPRALVAVFPEAAEVLQPQAPSPVSGQRVHLPVQRTPFVGRSHEVEEIHALLTQGMPQRLLTIVGPGGIGKTRLALAAASSLAPHFRHGVAFVPLAALSTAAQIVPALMESLGLVLSEGSEPRQQLMRFLHRREMLVVLDNLEHLAGGSVFVAEILEQTTQVKILVTSRGRLNLSDETVYAPGGLAYPPWTAGKAVQDETLLRNYGAVALLLQRAQMAFPSLTIDADDWLHIVRICNLVEGMPLALVLAASWLDMISFEDLADELAQSLALLENDTPDLPARQRSVQATFDYSWKLLEEEERRAFLALTVFRGGFTRQAAEAVAGAGLRTLRTLRILRTLANKSFISADRQGRFELHEVLRQMGWERLRQTGNLTQTRDAHTAYFLDLMAVRTASLYGGAQREAIAEIAQELGNVRDAWAWALEQSDLHRLQQALEAVFLFGYIPSRFSEAIELLVAACESIARDTLLWQRAAMRRAFLQAFSNPQTALLDEADALLAQAQRQGEARDLAFARLLHGCVTAFVGHDAQAAIGSLEKALHTYQTLNDPFYIVKVKLWLGFCHHNTSGLTQFNSYIREALELAQKTGNEVYAVSATSNLAAGAFCEGNYDHAERFSREALVIAEEMGLGLSMAHGKVQLALAHLLKGDRETAEALARKGLEEAQDINDGTTISYALSVLSLCHSLCGDLITGQALAEEALEIPTTIFGRILAEWAMGTASYGVGDVQGALLHARQSIQTAQQAGYPGMSTWALPVLALALADGEQKESAVALLALALSHPLAPARWAEQTPLLVEARARLEQSIGAHAFGKAWRAGRELDLEAALQLLLAGRPVLAGKAATESEGRLPAPSAPLIGRRREMRELQKLVLEAPGRLVTVEGPGGMGKTRLTLAVAEALSSDFEHGAYFVQLATLTAPSQIPAAVAEQVGLRFYSGEDLEQQLIAFLRERRLLLVLDNFEHLMNGAVLVAAILELSPDVRIIVTSRERLNLQAETVYALQGLAFPPQDEEITDNTEGEAYPAVQLLLQQAQLLIPGFTPHTAALVAAGRIARLVEGMPLALLLASSWLSLLSFEEIAAEISADIDFLASEARDLPPRQRSMRAVFDGSWERATAEERAVLARLAVFQGSFERQAAETIASATPRILLNLLQKSWLQRTDDGRFHIHELLRQYAAMKLKEDARAWEDAQQAHAAFYAALLSTQLNRLRGAAQVAAQAQMKADANNIRQAWQWLVAQGVFDVIVEQMLPALFRYSETRAASFTLLQLLEQALQRMEQKKQPGMAVQRAILLAAKGSFFRNGYPVRFESFGMVVPAREKDVREAWALAAEAGSLGSPFWDTLVGYIYGRMIDREAGIAHIRAQLPVLEEEATAWEMAFCLEVLALLLMMRPATRDHSALQEAHEIINRALALFEKVQDGRERGLCLRTLGQIHRLQSRFPEAIELWEAAQAQLEEVGDHTVAADVNWQIGDAYLQMGQVERAFPYYRRMSELYLSLGHNRVAAMVLSKESYEAARYGDLDYARQTREKALWLAEESGDDYSTAWNRWEMGELLRLSGDAAAARTWFEEARLRFQAFGDTTGVTFYHRGRGDLALAAGALEEAYEAYTQSMQQAQIRNHHWAMAYALAGLAIVCTRLGQSDRAREHVAQSLQLAAEVGDGGVALRAMAAAALYFAVSDQSEQAVQTAEFVWRHPISWVETRSFVKPLLSAAEQPLGVLSETGAQRKERELWQMAARLLQTLA